jgi:transcriptional regulator with XRE-family HTH domain
MGRHLSRPTYQVGHIKLRFSNSLDEKQNDGHACKVLLDRGKVGTGVDTMTQTVGELIKQLRGARSQREIGDAVGGLSGSAVSDWERGVTLPMLSHAIKLDDVLGADGQIVGAVVRATAEDRPVAVSPKLNGAAKLPAEVTDLAAGIQAVLDEIRELGARVDRLAREVQEIRELDPPPTPEAPAPPLEPGKPPARPRRPSSTTPPQ